MHSGDVDPHASPPTSPKNQATAGGESTQFRRPQNRMLAILCCFLAVLCILVLGSVSVIEWTFRLPFDIDAPTTVAGFNYGAHATLERQIHHTKANEAQLREQELRRKYTVRVNTFRRNDLLKKVVEHYVTCPRIDSIQIIWSDLDAIPPPMSFYNIRKKNRYRKIRSAGGLISKGDGGGQAGSTIERSEGANANGVSSPPENRRRALSDERSGTGEEVSRVGKDPGFRASELFPLTGETPRVEYEVHNKDSLNNRFRPILDINTEAVFSVDDDLYIPCSLLNFAHGVWQSSPRSMVGFMPRMHGYDEMSHKFTYHDWWYTWRHGLYSMILTKACFLHRDFLYYYAGTRSLSSLNSIRAFLPPSTSSTSHTAPSSRIKDTTASSSSTRRIAAINSGDEGKRHERRLSWESNSSSPVSLFSFSPSSSSVGVSREIESNSDEISKAEVFLTSTVEPPANAPPVSSSTLSPPSASTRSTPIPITGRRRPTAEEYAEETNRRLRQRRTPKERAGKYAPPPERRETPMPPPGSTMYDVQAYVDKHMNCEDIAMSFLVANLTEMASTWVRGTGIREIGRSGLSSNQKVHYRHRSDCVAHFTQLFGRMPLLVANQKVDRAVNFWLWR